MRPLWDSSFGGLPLASPLHPTSTSTSDCYDWRPSAPGITFDRINTDYSSQRYPSRMSSEVLVCVLMRPGFSIHVKRRETFSGFHYRCTPKGFGNNSQSASVASHLSSYVDRWVMQ